MAKSDVAAELLAGSAGGLTDGEVCEATGLSGAYVGRLRRDGVFVAEVNRRAKVGFVSALPRVLLALRDAACEGGNASAMKLFLDACRVFEGELGGSVAAGRDEVAAVAGLVERLRAAGVDVGGVGDERDG